MQIVEGFCHYQHDKGAEEMHHYALKMQFWAIRHPQKSSQTSSAFFCKTKINRLIHSNISFVQLY